MQLDTGSGVMHLPNSQVLAAAVSRRAGATEPAALGHDGPDGQLLPPSGAEVRDGGNPAS